ncbi:DNA-binding protein Ewg isoform X4 [Drosophila tropicalis]|uniref:DNA-binding protein Ewg isoform X4 n=1 Tax=Drosophila tropicalis TaxID=46794 RepID=UPI0035AC26A1
MSSDGSFYGEDEAAAATVADGLQPGHDDAVAQQLAAAGPVGVAAAAAIASSKKRKRSHMFETNPSVRKRQQNRLLRKLRGIIYEFTGRVGKQAVVLVATPGKPNTSYKVFGAKPLEDVLRNLKNIVMDELDNALAQQAPPPQQEDPTLFELPGLVIDGIPTPVEKMTQAQLRAFIPLMLKYSTGRGKPGWGRESTRPPWWPKELPWANVRMDARSEDDKQKISWTHALRKIVINCYKYHGRDDLLPTFADEDEKVTALIAQINDGVGAVASNVNQNNHRDHDDDDDDDNDDADENDLDDLPEQQQQQIVSTRLPTGGSSHTYTTTQTVLSQNPDGTVSIIQVDPNNPIITLPDGTTAQVQGVATLHQGEGGTTTIQTVQSLSDVNGHENMTVDLTEAQDGQIYFTTEDGQDYPVSVSNVISVPVSMYQTVMANMQQLQTNSDGTVCLAPMQVQVASGNNINNNSHTTAAAAATITSSGSNSSTGTINAPPALQCYQLITATSGAINRRPHQQQAAITLQATTPAPTTTAANTVAATPRFYCLNYGQGQGSGTFNLNNNNNNNHNTNNNNNNNNNNATSATIKMPMPMPIVLANSTGATANLRRRTTGTKRRRQKTSTATALGRGTSAAVGAASEVEAGTSAGPSSSGGSSSSTAIRCVDSANLQTAKTIKLEHLE